MAARFIDFLRARVLEGNQDEANALLDEHFAGHESGRQAYKQAWDSAEEIAHLMTRQGPSAAPAEGQGVEQNDGEVQ